MGRILLQTVERDVSHLSANEHMRTHLDRRPRPIFLLLRLLTPLNLPFHITFDPPPQLRIFLQLIQTSDLTLTARTFESMFEQMRLNTFLAIGRIATWSSDRFPDELMTYRTGECTVEWLLVSYICAGEGSRFSSCLFLPCPPGLRQRNAVIKGESSSLVRNSSNKTSIRCKHRSSRRPFSG